MRICHLGKYYPPAPGGIETHVQTLARAQAALGADVRVVCVNHMNRAGRDVTWSRRGMTPTVTEDDRGVRVTRLGRSAHVAKLDVVPDLRQCFARLKRETVDVLHLHTPNPTMLLAVAALRPWAPLVITHHSDVVKQRVLYRAFAPFERLVYDRAVGVFSNSPGYIDDSTALQRERGKVETVPMGLDLTPYLRPSPAARAESARLRAEHGPAIWLSVGRCVYYKGYDVALKALRDVPGKLIIIGQGPYKAYLLKLAGELGVAGRVIWWDRASPEELAGAYHAATALWFPSNARSEAFGLVQVEAMASGCPVINTAIPASGAPWVSRDGISGITVPIGEPAAVADAAKRILNDPDLRERLSAGAVHRAVAKFADDAMGKRTLNSYERLLHAAPAARGTEPLGAPGPSPAPVQHRPRRLPSSPAADEAGGTLWEGADELEWAQ
jgi:glycosyltransferase involved in cell wall biosynthesis